MPNLHSDPASPQDLPESSPALGATISRSSTSAPASLPPELEERYREALARLQARSPGVPNKPAEKKLPSRWLTILLVIAAGILLGYGVTREPAPAPTGSASATPAAPPQSEAERIIIRGVEIRRGMKFDDVVSALRPQDAAGNPQVNPDPVVSDSLVVTHTYLIEGRLIRVEARRSQHAGPYLVSQVRAEAHQAAASKPETPAGDSASRAYSLLAEQKSRYSQVVAAVQRAKGSGSRSDLAAAVRTLEARNAELVRLIGQIEGGNYSASDRAAILSALRQEQEWAASSAVLLRSVQ